MDKPKPTMLHLDPKVACHIADLAQEHRTQAKGGLWGLFAAGWHERIAVNFVYDETDQRLLARGDDADVREVFTATITALRRDPENIAVEKLQALAASYGVRRDRHHWDWQTVVIERSTVLYGWTSPNGIDNAVGAAPEGMNALGFLSLALPELLADLVHGTERGSE